MHAKFGSWPYISVIFESCTEDHACQLSSADSS